MGGSGGALGELWEAQGQLWEALAELREALGELWEGLYIQKLPINRPSGRYVIALKYGAQVQDCSVGCGATHDEWLPNLHCSLRLARPGTTR